MFEFLLVNGVDFFKAVRMLIPPARHNVAHMPAKLRSFYEYTSAAWEPWDGPAAVSLTNGRYVSCVLDRNGLRPAKYLVTTDDRLLLTSEYGVLGVPPEQVRAARPTAERRDDCRRPADRADVHLRDIDRYLMNSQPYSEWLTDRTWYLMEFIEHQFDDLSDYRFTNLTQLQRYHHITHETVEYAIKPMLRDGREPTGSMGDDTPQAAFSEVPRPFADYFRQKFAQVTNPPIDPYREKVVMSATIGVGEIGNPLIETSDRARRLKNISPVLSRDIFDALLSFGDPEKPRFETCYRHRSFTTGFDHDLRRALDALGDAVVEAVRNDGVRVVILDDRVLDAQTRLIPMAMAVGHLNQRLLREELRHLVSLIAVTGEVTDPHQACVLLGYGALAIYPWLFYATGLQMCEQWQLSPRETRRSLKNLYEALTKGILKVMSKMGISTVSSYRNAALFDIIGLSREVVDNCFPASANLLPGLDYADLEARIAGNHALLFRKSHMLPVYPLAIGSVNRDNPGGEYHDFHSQVITTLHQYANTLQRDDYLKFRALIAGRGERFIRDFFVWNSPRPPIPVDEVEPVEAITRRFDSAAMSLGSISPEAHEALAEAMHILGGSSNSGEGGEDPARLKTIRNSKIKQIASGRFGVTPAYLRSADRDPDQDRPGGQARRGGPAPRREGDAR